jgi:uncharacterized protein YhaN
MIFSKIYVENFGALHDFELSLSGGVNRVSGKNEFGKTTLLEFVRRLFWGFPDRRSRNGRAAHREVGFAPGKAV